MVKKHLFNKFYKNMLKLNRKLKIQKCTKQDLININDIKSIKVKLIERKNVYFEEKDKKYKCLEYTKLDGCNSKIAITIGFNPAIIDVDKIDRTNLKIINCLQKLGYSECFLLNLNIQVSKNKKQFSKDNNDEQFEKLLVGILSSVKNVDIIIFWGRTVSISSKFKKFLVKRMKKLKNVYKTTKKSTNKHYHPARVQIEIKNIELKDFITKDDKYFLV